MFRRFAWINDNKYSCLIALGLGDSLCYAGTRYPIHTYLEVIAISSTTWNPCTCAVSPVSWECSRNIEYESMVGDAIVPLDFPHFSCGNASVSNHILIDNNYLFLEDDCLNCARTALTIHLISEHNIHLSRFMANMYLFKE